MQSIKNNNYHNIVKDELKKSYLESKREPLFNNLVSKLKISDEVGMVNTTRLLDCIIELKNCEQCKGLFCCKNKMIGHYLYPTLVNDTIDLNYVSCKYKKENDFLIKEKANNNNELEKARFKDIDVTDKKRVKVIRWLKDFYDNYDGIKNIKGLYLHGTFGSGKSYLIYALLNELRINKHVNFVAVYYPDIIRSLKDDWDLYSTKMNLYMNTPILLLDDIGAEQVSEWSRDEVLGTILQYRMNNYLPTFFTSNLDILELEQHLSISKSKMDEVKARRIIERIKQLTIDIELIAENKRK